VAELRRNVTIEQSHVTDNQQLLQSAQTLFDEMNNLRGSGAVSNIEYIAALDRLATRRAAVRTSEATLEKAKLALDAILDNEHAFIREAESDLALAKWRLEQALVVAPADGHVTNLQLQPGASVGANSPVMTFVDSLHWWVIANFDENLTKRIKPGQPAEISLRSDPGRTYKARVDSVGWGVERGQGSPSGRLPAPDSSQIWIRPPQRLPVKVLLDTDAKDGILVMPRIGSSVSVTVYTSEPNLLNPLAALWQRLAS